MKQILVFFLVSCVHFFYSCAGNKRVASLPVVTIALPSNEEGTIMIRSSGQGDSENSAVFNSEEKAFNTLFFYGLPSSAQVRPLIENESEIRRSNPQFFNEFFSSGAYKNFIVNSYNYSGVQKTGKTYYLNRDIKINLRSLRSYLENKGIIRKFGY